MQIDVPATIMYATGKEGCGVRKPETGMWDFFVEHLNGGVQPGKRSAKTCLIAYLSMVRLYFALCAKSTTALGTILAMHARLIAVTSQWGQKGLVLLCREGGELLCGRRSRPSWRLCRQRQVSGHISTCTAHGPSWAATQHQSAVTDVSQSARDHEVSLWPLRKPALQEVCRGRGDCLQDS